MPDWNISRNNSQRSSQREIRDGGDSRDKPGNHWRGATKIAKNPVSNNKVSHWNERNVWPTTDSDRYSAHNKINTATGDTPTRSSTENAVPAAQRKFRKPSLALNQQSVGSSKNRPTPTFCAWKYFSAPAINCPAGIMPLLPISPLSCVQSERNATR